MKTRAYSLRLELGLFDFIFTMILTKHAFNVMLATTLLLQGEEMEIASGVHIIESLVGNIITMREKCDEKHEVFYEESNAVAAGLHMVSTTVVFLIITKYV